MIIRKGQTYSNKSLTRYYEILAIFNGLVDFTYYDSRANKQKNDIRPVAEFEQQIKDGWLVRDL